MRMIDSLAPWPPIVRTLSLPKTHSPQRTGGHDHSNPVVPIYVRRTSGGVSLCPHLISRCAGEATAVM